MRRVRSTRQTGPVIPEFRYAKTPDCIHKTTGEGFLATSEAWPSTIAARVGAMAGPSEVLMSSTVKDLVAGSGPEFADRGEHELKGVPGEWRLYAVAASDA